MGSGPPPRPWTKTLREWIRKLAPAARTDRVVRQVREEMKEYLKHLR